MSHNNSVVLSRTNLGEYVINFMNINDKQNALTKIFINCFDFCNIEIIWTLFDNYFIYIFTCLLYTFFTWLSLIQ